MLCHSPIFTKYLSFVLDNLFHSFIFLLWWKRLHKVFGVVLPSTGNKKKSDWELMWPCHLCHRWIPVASCSTSIRPVWCGTLQKRAPVSHPSLSLSLSFCWFIFRCNTTTRIKQPLSCGFRYINEKKKRHGLVILKEIRRAKYLWIYDIKCTILDLCLLEVPHFCWFSKLLKYLFDDVELEKVGNIFSKFLDYFGDF